MKQLFIALGFVAAGIFGMEMYQAPQILAVSKTTDQEFSDGDGVVGVSSWASTRVEDDAYTFTTANGIAEINYTGQYRVSGKVTVIPKDIVGNSLSYSAWLQEANGSGFASIAETVARSTRIEFGLVDGWTGSFDYIADFTAGDSVRYAVDITFISLDSIQVIDAAIMNIEKIQ